MGHCSFSHRLGLQPDRRRLVAEPGENREPNPLRAAEAGPAPDHTRRFTLHGHEAVRVSDPVNAKKEREKLAIFLQTGGYYFIIVFSPPKNV